MLNILYIGNAESIHDIKWMCYFSEKTEHYRVFAVNEKQNKISEKTAEYLTFKNINLLPSIDTFSLRSPLKTRASIKMLKSYITKHNIHIVHVLFASPHALWINYLTIPAVITTRGSDVLRVLPELKKQGGLKGLYFRYLFGLFKKSFAKAVALTSTSKAQIRQIETLFGRPDSVLIRTGIEVDAIIRIDKPELLNKKLQNQKFIFSPRFMAPVYNIDIQTEALKYLPAELIKNFVFVFVRGKNYDKAYYQNQVQKLEKLKKEIGLQYIVEEYLDQETLWMYFKKASLSIMTPISDGTPNSALEAMAAGSPLILPDLPYDADLFENECMVTTITDAKTVADTIIKALNDYPQNRIGLAADRVKTKGNRAIEMAKLEQIYTRIPGI